jgi:hypothetical protein
MLFVMPALNAELTPEEMPILRYHQMGMAAGSDTLTFDPENADAKVAS